MATLIDSPEFSANEIYEIQQTTRCDYVWPVPFAKHVLRMLPVNRPGQHVLATHVSVTPKPARQNILIDFFGNHVIQVDLDVPHESLVVSVSAIAPVSAIGHPAKGRIELRQNGQVRQSADFGDMVWSVPEIIAHLSGFYHLAPGDLIFTGTPAGVGPVAPGDMLEGSIAGVGELKVTIGESQ